MSLSSTAPNLHMNAQMRQLITGQQQHAFSFAFQLTRNADSAQELVQEASMRAIEKWGQRDARRAFAPWLLTILKNRYLDGLRSARHRLTDSMDALVASSDRGHESRLEVVPDDSESPLDHMLRMETGEMVRKILAGLPFGQRRVLVLRDMNGRTYAATARLLGVSLGALRSRLYRARCLFRERFVLLEACQGEGSYV